MIVMAQEGNSSSDPCFKTHTGAYACHTLSAISGSEAKEAEIEEVSPVWGTGAILNKAGIPASHMRAAIVADTISAIIEAPDGYLYVD